MGIGKLRVFVSHSNLDRAATETLVSELEHRDRELLVDYDDIPLGEPWPKHIDEWLLYSHAALILFSPNVLRQPDWVKREADILGIRKNALDPRFAIVPVFLPGFDPNMLTEAPFHTANLNPVEGIAFDPSSPDLDELRKLLDQRTEELIAHEIEWKFLDDAVAAKLGVSGAAQRLCELLEIDSAMLRYVREPTRWLARKLFGLSVAELGSILNMLGPIIGVERAIALLNDVAPFCWVPREIADSLAERAQELPPKRCVHIPCKEEETPEMVVRCASRRLPAWMTVSCGSFSHEDAPPGASGGALPATILDDIEADLRRRWNFRRGGRADVARQLERFVQGSGPLVLLLSQEYAALDAALIEGIADEFEHASVVVSGEELSESLQGHARVITIPSLANVELDSLDAYRMYHAIIKGG